MHSSTWKRREREAARLFGSLRQIGSGSLGRAERSTSDSIHERLYVEVKCRPDHLVRKTLADIRPIVGGAVPAVQIHPAGPRFVAVTCFHSSDFARVPVSRWDTRAIVRSRDAVLSLMDGTAPKATAEGKLPVLMLASHHRKGFVVCVRTSDMGAFKQIIIT